MNSSLRLTFACTTAAAVLAAFSATQTLGAPESATGFTFEQVASYPFPTELTAASESGRIAWAFNEQGRRNIWVAEGPGFAARRLPHTTSTMGGSYRVSRCPLGETGSSMSAGVTMGPIGTLAFR